jgi:hypothetical protein
MDEFDFCPNSRVIVEKAPNESSPIQLNGYQYAPKPSAAYQRTFECTLYGMKWYLGAGGLDESKNPKHNVGRLLKFYREHRLFKPFNLRHEYLGLIQCRFSAPVNPDPAIGNGDGLVEEINISLVHHNARY